MSDQKVDAHLYHGTSDLVEEMVLRNGLCATELCSRNFAKCQRGIYATTEIFSAWVFAGIATHRRVQDMGITDPFQFADELYSHKDDIYRFKQSDLPQECREERDPAWHDAVRFKDCDCIPPKTLEVCAIPKQAPTFTTGDDLVRFCETRWRKVKP